MSFKMLPDAVKPRERFCEVGVNNLTNEELLSIILKTGTKDKNVKEIAWNIVSSLKDIDELKNMTLNKLMTYDGIGKVKAMELLSAVELGRRIFEEVKVKDIIDCTSPKNIIDYFNYMFKGKKQEEFHVIYLDTKKRFIEKKFLFKGSANFSIAHPREIFKEAYLLSASYIICLHNHPTGDATPSREDIELTRKIIEIGKIHSIPLIDHIIIGNNNYYSFYENGYIK